eukprot:CAMPEP_0183567134 /NCGR_PEP_ID=MMETSP0371-20130417/113572_1 /TAXON_ID=268820 /ORGANISM="Peridinium aciculiferum, Strain PAER-2" /LENGTH=72 /DNA_ID=CAMNT_0025776479 /DNA_START=416 /DNA_END=634 /DNA_ORIENTATION=+
MVTNNEALTECCRIFMDSSEHDGQHGCSEMLSSCAQYMNNGSEKARMHKMIGMATEPMMQPMVVDWMRSSAP